MVKMSGTIPTAYAMDLVLGLWDLSCLTMELMAVMWMKGEH